MPTHKHHGELDCWPDLAAQAYDRAIALGSPTAAARKDDLQAARDFHHQIDPTSPLQPCAPPGALDVTPPELSRS